MPPDQCYDLQNTVINDVLCYISTSRAALATDSIILNTIAFYKGEIIKKAKDIYFGICKEKPITRKPCNSHPNPASADLGDILDLMEKMESKDFSTPRFVAAGYSSLPPSTGFESVAAIICSLRDEVTALREEICENRKLAQRDLKSLEGVSCVIQDVAEIKTILMSRLSITSENSKSFLSGPSTSLSTSNHSSNKCDNGSSAQAASTVDATNVLVNVENRSFRDVLLEGDTQPADPKSIPKNKPKPKPKPVTKRVNIVGTKTTSNNSQNALLGVKRVFDIFVGGCPKDTQSAAISAYCVENGVTTLKCESLATKSEWSASFKLSVNACEREKLLCADFWPEGMFVRKYFRARASRL